MKDDEGIEEIFVIKTRSVFFFGAVVKVAKEMTAAHGSVRFQDGKRWYFQLPTEDRQVLRKRLEALCVELAVLFNVDFLHHTFQNAVHYDQFADMCNTRIRH